MLLRMTNYLIIFFHMNFIFFAFILPKPLMISKDINSLHVEHCILILIQKGLSFIFRD